MLRRKRAKDVGRGGVGTPKAEKRKRAEASVRKYGDSAKLPAITPERAISNIKVAGCRFQIFVFASIDPKIADVGKTPEKRGRVAFRSHEGVSHPRIKVLEAPGGMSEGTIISEDDWCKPGEQEWAWVDKLAAFILHSYALHSRVQEDCRVLGTIGHDDGHNSYALKQVKYVYEFYRELYDKHLEVLDSDFELFMSRKYGDFYNIQALYIELKRVVGMGVQSPSVCEIFDALKSSIYTPCQLTLDNQSRRVKYLRELAAREAGLSAAGVVVGSSRDLDGEKPAADAEGAKEKVEAGARKKLTV